MHCVEELWVLCKFLAIIESLDRWRIGIIYKLLWVILDNVNVNVNKIEHNVYLFKRHLLIKHVSSCTYHVLAWDCDRLLINCKFKKKYPSYALKGIIIFLKYLLKYLLLIAGATIVIIISLFIIIIILIRYDRYCWWLILIKM